MELASKYTLNFEYVKGVKNTLADTMSRLVTLDPDIKLVKEPEGYQFGKQIELNDDVAETEVRLISLAPVTPVSNLEDLWTPSQIKTYCSGELVQKK